MKLPRVLASSMGLLRIASILVLVSLGLMAWGITHPRPLPVIVAMSIGQGVGTLGALFFIYVVLRDLRQVLRSRKAPPPPPSLRPESPESSPPTS